MKNSKTLQIPALRTPEDRFLNLPGYPFSPHYMKVNGGLQMHYLDEHSTSDQVVLLLHGEPSWSYLYRKMIPVFVEAGYRVIVPDLIGFGKSDKPIQMSDYTYQRHVDWVRELIFDHLQLQQINMFVQDWGGLIGLRILVEHPEKFRRIVAGNTAMPTGDQPMPEAFLKWQKYSQTVQDFPIGGIIQKSTVNELSTEIIAAYDAPFPEDEYKAGARIFPALVPTNSDDPATEANRKAWMILSKLEIPFLTLFSDNDPITKGVEKVFQKIVAGAKNQPHTIIQNAGHFLQEDKGEEIANLMIEFIQ